MFAVQNQVNLISNESCCSLSNYYMPDTELSALSPISFMPRCNCAWQR